MLRRYQKLYLSTCSSCFLWPKLVETQLNGFLEIVYLNLLIYFLQKLKNLSKVRITFIVLVKIEVTPRTLGLTGGFLLRQNLDLLSFNQIYKVLKISQKISLWMILKRYKKLCSIDFIPKKSCKTRSNCSCIWYVYISKQYVSMDNNQNQPKMVWQYLLSPFGATTNIVKIKQLNPGKWIYYVKEAYMYRCKYFFKSSICFYHLFR